MVGVDGLHERFQTPPFRIGVAYTGKIFNPALPVVTTLIGCYEGVKGRAMEVEDLKIRGVEAWDFGD